MSASAKNHSVSVAAALVGAIALFGLPSVAAASVHAASVTSHSPWLAPVGHRQPKRDDVPQAELLSSWERQQQDLDVELDRKLVICRGC